MTQSTNVIQPVRAPASAPVVPQRPEPRQIPPQHGAAHGIKKAAGFLAWIFTGFGMLHLLRPGRRFKLEEVVVYSVHRSFFLWALILVGFVGGAMVKHYPSTAGVFGWIYIAVLVFTFVTILFDLSTLKFLLWTGIFAFVFLISKYIQDLKHVPMLSVVFLHLRSLHPRLDHGFAAVTSWLLLGPWIGALFHSFSRGRKTFSCNGIEEWFLGDGREITDRSGLKFRTRYRDLFESFLTLGGGDLEAVDSNHVVVKRWENVVGLIFVWRRLDEILHQRSAVVDNEAIDPVEVEAVKRPAATDA